MIKLTKSDLHLYSKVPRIRPELDGFYAQGAVRPTHVLSAMAYISVEPQSLIITGNKWMDDGD